MAVTIRGEGAVRIDEGNIFELMRLVLPEHREMMERMKKKMQVHKIPVLAEDKMEQMQYTLQDALENEQPIRVTLYNPFEDEIHEGIPIMKGNKLYLSNGAGMLPLVIEEIKCLEMM